MDGQPALPVGALQEALGHDGHEALGQLHADLGLGRGRIGIQDPVDGLFRVVGVERAEDQVAGLGRAQGRGDRLDVAHLADQDDVRVLAQGAAESLGEVTRIRPHLALVDDGHLVLVHELDGVLQGDDVGGYAAVDVIDDGGEGPRPEHGGEDESVAEDEQRGVDRAAR